MSYPTPTAPRLVGSARRPAVKLIRQKLLGTFILGAIGFAGGWLLSLSDSPERATRDIVVFSLAGAVLGSMLAGWKFGLVGKGSAAGLIIGAICGWSGNYPKFSQELPWAIAGYLIGFTIGLILEYTAVEPGESNSQPESTALRDEPSSQ